MLEVALMNEDFFEGVDQVALKLPSGDIKFPIFYRDARMFTVVVPANLFALKRALPDPRLVPAQLVPGVGALALTAFEYYDTDIQPYNEFSMGILLNTPEFVPVPGYNMLRQLFADFFNVFIWQLPVTTELALRGGIDFYNYPKSICAIDFSDTEDRITCDLSRDGTQILSMTGPKVPTRNLGVKKFICNLYQSKQPQKAEFKINVREGCIQWLPGEVSWAFNRSHETGRALSDMVIGSRAAMYFYMPSIQCILYGPEYIPIQLLHYIAGRQGFLPKAPARKAAARKAPAKKKAVE